VKLFYYSLLLLALGAPVTGFADDDQCLTHAVPASPACVGLAHDADAAAARVPAPALPTCTARMIEACGRLASAHPGVLEHLAEHTGDTRIVPNPLSLTRDYPASDHDLFSMDHVDRHNVDTAITPMFHRLRDTLRTWVQNSHGDATVRQQLVDRLSHLEVRVENFERCSRGDRPPVVARFTGTEVLICPFLSHMRAIDLATILAHELGHAVDLCDEEFPQPPNATGFPFEVIHQCASRVPTSGGAIKMRPAGSPATCDRDGEIYADYNSTALTARTFAQSDFPSDPQEALISYAGFRLASQCDTDTQFRYFVRPILQSGLAEHLLNCAGVDGDTICQGHIGQ
jgi:hypothetical protein